MDWSVIFQAEWMELWLPIIRDLIIIFMVAVVIPALRAGIAWWRKLTIEAWIKELIIDAVLYAQEKFWNQAGADKFLIAKEWVLAQLKEKGITVTEEWLDAMIDAIVKQLRAELGDEEWYREGSVKSDLPDLETKPEAE